MGTGAQWYSGKPQSLTIEPGITIELSDDYSNPGIPMRICRFIIDNAIIDFVNDRVERYVNFGALSVVIGGVMGHCIMGKCARHIGLEHLNNAFC